MSAFVVIDLDLQSFFEYAPTKWHQKNEQTGENKKPFISWNFALLLILLKQFNLFYKTLILIFSTVGCLFLFYFYEVLKYFLQLPGQRRFWWVMVFWPRNQRKEGVIRQEKEKWVSDTGLAEPRVNPWSLLFCFYTLVWFLPLERGQEIWLAFTQ